MLSNAGRVLVVDDQDNWRLALTVLLEGEGLQVSQASSFREAMDILARTAPFNVVILDIRLVDEDVFNVEGLELLHFIRSNHPVTRTIVLTGYPTSLRGEPDADGFVSKVPHGSTFDSVGFKKRVRELVEQSMTAMNRKPESDR